MDGLSKNVLCLRTASVGMPCAQGCTIVRMLCTPREKFWIKMFFFSIICVFLYKNMVNLSKVVARYRKRVYKSSNLLSPSSEVSEKEFILTSSPKILCLPQKSVVYGDTHNIHVSSEITIVWKVLYKIKCRRMLQYTSQSV